ncbi:hypothetical protein [Meiothermus sp. Pnk-1]|uniref:hypothetical protein n=1 Tax=Meiothermus sp. Pnk-1 TaxID=873128 RepID=UPI0011B73292|nr:hypothetical protein [Meiothermus sp. Pnk-1]
MTNIRRSSRDRRGFVVYNETANDLELTAEALGVLVYILSKPDHWRVNVADLQKRRGMGRDKAYRIMRELIANRYAQFVEYYEPNGQVKDGEYVIYDVRQPEGLEPKVRRPITEKPDTAQPDTAQPDTAFQEADRITSRTPLTENPDPANPDTAEPDPANPEHSINPVVVNTEIKSSLSKSARETKSEKASPAPTSTPRGMGEKSSGGQPAEPPQTSEDLPGAAAGTTPKDDLEAWEATFTGFKRSLILAARKDPAARPYYFTLARKHRQALGYALAMGAKQGSRDTETFRAWLPDLVQHIEQFGADAVASALQESIKRAGSSPWGFYLKLLSDKPATPLAPSAPAVDYNDPAARAELYKRLPLAGEKRRVR